MIRHLWEFDHPYYCGEANWHHNRDGTSNHQTWESWQDFTDETIFTSGDRDMNLLIRWDWHSWRRHPDPGLRDEKEPDQLMLFFVMQRKGYLCSHYITVTDDDEPAVRTWLAKCSRTTAAIWAPFLPVEDQ